MTLPRSVKPLSEAYHAFLLIVFSFTVLLQGCKGAPINSQAYRFFSEPQKLKMAHAIEEGDTTTIREMIQKHFVAVNDFGTADKERPISFLTYAVMVKNKDSIRALFVSGANPNFKTPQKGGRRSFVCASSGRTAFAL